MRGQMRNAGIETIVIPEAQVLQVEELYRLVKMGNATINGADGLHQLELPDPLYRLLLRIVGHVAKGRLIAYVAGTQDLTTQQAANLLGMPRPLLLNLIDTGVIPYHRAGTHRRLIFNDVMAFRKGRDRRRHEALNQMATDALQSGHYDEF